MPLLSVDDALKIILADANPSASERLPLQSAGGRILSEPVSAKLLQPPFDCSAMDGYAIIAPENAAYPVTFEIIGESVAGSRFEGNLTEGQAVRIFTGAPMPAGADTVVIQEYTDRSGNSLIVHEGIEKGRHIRKAGLDFAPGDIVLDVGKELDSTALSLAAASGNADLSVFKMPRIAILATGDELVSPGTIPGPDQIVASNSIGIAEIVRTSGGIAQDLGIVSDELTLIESAINQALDSDIDILVTIGGASVGDRDLVHTALQACGVELGFWKIAMRPGKPLMYGHRMRDNKAVCVIGLPGNPVSSLVCSLVFLRPLISKLAGRRQTEPDLTARLGTALPANAFRRNFIRAALRKADDGSWIATPHPIQDSSILTAMANSQALIIREENAPPASAGDFCRILPL